MSKLSQLPLRERIRIWGGPDILTEAGNAIEVLEEEIERLTAEVQRKAEEIETWQTRSIELARSLIKITEHKPSSDCFFCGSGPGCDHGDDCPLHIAESALIDSGLDTFDSGSQKPRIIEREAKMSGVWFECSECGDELYDIGTDEGGSHLECGTCGHAWYEGEYINPTVKGQEP